MFAYIRKVIAIRREEGASAVEYGLLVAAIAALIVIVVFALGGVIKGVFSKTCSQIDNGANPGGATASCSG
jgi:pilus assembly protein Flp/PilA